MEEPSETNGLTGSNKLQHY